MGEIEQRTIEENELKERVDSLQKKLDVIADNYKDPTPTPTPTSYDQRRDIHVFRIFIQAVIAGAILAGAFFFLVDPIIEAQKAVSSKESKLALLQAKIQEEENRLIKQANIRETQSLRTENEILKGELTALLDTSKKIEMEREAATASAEDLQKRLENISTKLSSVSQQKSELEELSIFTRNESERLKVTIENSKRVATKNSKRTKSLTEQLKFREIAGKQVKIWYRKKQESDAEKIMMRLIELGANVETEEYSLQTGVKMNSITENTKYQDATRQIVEAVNNLGLGELVINNEYKVSNNNFDIWWYFD